jgi:SAM-dependent methyltransferase
LNGGALAASSIRKALRKANVRIEELDNILDFGCGSGRVIRHWRSLRSTQVYGTDYNPKLVEWCREHLRFAKFSANHLNPPLAYAESQFDLVYALSVYTHLTEALQDSWIDEFSRVLKAGGHLLISTHGDAYIHRLDNHELMAYKAGRLVVKNDVTSPGKNTCSAYHPMPYVRDDLVAEKFEVIDFVPEGAKGNPRQDLYVLRKPLHAKSFA